MAKAFEHRHPNFINAFYGDGPAGAGKTFIYEKITHYVRPTGRIVLIVAVSGIAALLLPGGRTAHSRFRLPVPLPLEGARANIAANSNTAKLLRETALLIWDEAPNAPRAAFGAVNRCLQDVLQDLPNRDKRQPFGGLPVLLGGDFRQIPPVLRRVDINEFPAHTLKACDWWVLDRHVKRYKLVRNKRAEADPEYAAMILQIGDGEFDQDRRRATTTEPGATDTPQAAISLPDKFLAKQHDDLAELIDWTYGDWME